MKILIVATALLLSARCLAQVPEPYVDLGSFSGPVSTSRGYSVSSARLEETTSWSPEQGPVPLPMERALATGRQWLLKKHPNFEGFVPSRFDLFSPSHVAGPRYWVWSIHFNPVSGGRTLFGISFEAFVLMDGSIVEPQVGLPRSSSSK